jgi:hypothetical protein
MGKGKKRSEVSSMDFHAIYSASLVSGQFQGQLSPSGLAGVAPRFLAEADGYGYFRFDNFKARLHPISSAGTPLAVGFCGVQDTLPGTIAQVGELIDSTFLSINNTQPSDWVVCNKATLSGMFPWYKSVNGTFDTTEECPGFIVITGTTTQAFVLEIRFRATFKSPVATGNTPEELDLVRARFALRLKRAADEEKRKVVLALAPPLGPAPAAASAPRQLVCGVCDARAGGPHRADCPIRGTP